MKTSDGQVQKLMEELANHGRLGLAASVAGMDRKTARKYAKLGRLPSEMESPRAWRTRPDPFADYWPGMAARLESDPWVEAKVLFEDLRAQHPGRFGPGQLRTLQRRVRLWRTQREPARQVLPAAADGPGAASRTETSDVPGELRADAVAEGSEPLSTPPEVESLASTSPMPMPALRDGIFWY